MANPIPASYFPRRNPDSETSSSPVSDDVVTHEQTGEESTSPADRTLADGADAGTKGTGSAG
jgi:hypothetical protein